MPLNLTTLRFVDRPVTEEEERWEQRNEQHPADLLGPKWYPPDTHARVEHTVEYSAERSRATGRHGTRLHGRA